MDDYEKDIKCNNELVRDFEDAYYKNKIDERHRIQCEAPLFYSIDQNYLVTYCGSLDKLHK